MSEIARRILVVEDEERLVMALRDRLESEGYAVTVANDGESGFDAATRQPFDLVLLDVALPRKNGFDVCRDLRARGVQTPILMLTARGQVIDKVLGLKLGADDYLTKPFEPMELMARVEALLRRGAALSLKLGEIFQFGSVEVDFRKIEVRRHGERVELTAREFELLRYFIEQRDAVVSRSQLLREVWGYDEEAMT